MASNNRTGQAGELWPVFLLLVVVAVPTIGVLWFVGVAMENQRMATRQQLTELYRLHLQNVQKQIDTDWQRRLEQADDLADDEGAQEVFATAVTRGIGDSIVLYDEAARVRFPSTFATSRERQVGPEWTEARRLEDESASPLAASVVYARIAEKATTELERISAFQAQLRCLLQAGQPKTAHTLMVHLLQSDAFDSLADPHARSIAANIQLMMIEQLEPTMEVDRLVGRLAEMVNDYGESVLSSPQRLFLMKRLAEIAPSRIDQRLLNAEEMATRFVATQSTPSGDQLLRESQIPGMWQASVASGRMVILIQEANLLANIFQSATRTPLPVGADIYVTAPGDDSRIAALISSSAGAHLPGWRLSLALRDSHQIDTTAKQRNQLYLWTGIVVVLFTSVLGVFIARAFRRQIRMANFKNDLVGTVSHELKTPLSSMRLLVDTVLKQSCAQNTDLRRRFEQEARAVVALSHPHIRAIFDVAGDRGLHYLVMEYLEGQTLRDRLESSRLAWPEAVRVTSCIADGLAAAHEKGIVHRDIKPANVFLLPDGSVKILDFGLALVRSSNPATSAASTGTSAGRVLGTVNYMSPEQARGQETDARTDIFSLGVVLYEMLTATLPYARKTIADTTAAILHEDPPALEDSVTALPVGIGDVVRRCLEKNLSARCQSALELRDVLATLRVET